VLQQLNGRSEDAEKSCRRALVLQGKLANEHPNRPAYQQTLASSHNQLGILLQTRGRPEEAEQAYRQALTVWEKVVAAAPEVSDHPDRSYDAICLWARGAVLAERDEQLASEKRRELGRGYADRAIAVLRELVQLGFQDGDLLRRDRDLDVLRPREDFQKLLR